MLLFVLAGRGRGGHSRDGDSFEGFQNWLPRMGHPQSPQSWSEEAECRAPDYFTALKKAAATVSWACVLKIMSPCFTHRLALASVAASGVVMGLGSLLRAAHGLSRAHPLIPLHLKTAKTLNLRRPQVTSTSQTKKDQNCHCPQWWTIHCLGLFLLICASSCLTGPCGSRLPNPLRLLWASLTTCVLKLKLRSLPCAAPHTWHEVPVRVSSYNIISLQDGDWKPLTSLGTGALIPARATLQTGTVCLGFPGYTRLRLSAFSHLTNKC